MTPKPRVVLFDLDGTLLDSLDDITRALAAALRRHGVPAPPRGDVARMVGDGARMLVARALAAPVDDPKVAQVHASFVEEYSADPASAARPMPGALELLDALRGHGTVAVVCTNKPGPLSRRIVELTLGARVRATIGGGDAPRLKPAPDLVLAAVEASATGARPDEVVMVGDGPQDVLAARAAGIRAIAVRNGYGDAAKLAAAGADLYVDDLAALVPILV
ncbi:MAG: HAD-IA family hydrolase [Deltaproteobacteria bacterium]|nr:HAD-IA family hydrolase [Deltaproteobacteria bacterium]